MKKLTLASLYFFVVIIANAQKLPNVQTTSLRAPADIKIDGQATEWNNQYQAYNKNIEVFYTIANDDDNLYVLIHASNSRSIEKIIEGGISFTANNSGKKDDKKNVVILFPLLPLPIGKGTLVSAGKSLTGATHSDDREDLTQSLNATAQANRASSMAKANKELLENLKEIKISGISAIIDTIPGINPTTPYFRTLPLRNHSFKYITMINHDNIKAMTQFDEKRELTYELAIPIKYLNLPAGNTQKFHYNITVNARGEDGRPGNTWSFNPPGTEPRMKDQDMEEPTDFSGEYTLAKNNN